jgi:hypothetical protein
MLTATLNLISKQQRYLACALVTLSLALFLWAVMPRKQAAAQPVLAVQLAQAPASPYRSYGEITQLMELGRWQEAWDQSRALKEQLSSDHLLYGLNLTRMGFVAQQIEDKEAELAIWREWLEKPRPELDHIFQRGSVRLSDYAREMVEA